MSSVEQEPDSRLVIRQASQFVLRVAGASFLAWAFLDPRFRDAEGFLDSGCCLPLGVGVALLVLGWAVVGKLRKAAFWFALALVGQAVALQLVDAGPYMRYQHYKPWDRLLNEVHPLLLVYLLAQTVLVGVAFRNRLSKTGTWLRRSFRPWQLVGMGLVFFLSSATVSAQLSRYIFELPLAAYMQALTLVTVVLMVEALPTETLGRWKQRSKDLFTRFVGDSPAGQPRGDRVAILAAVWVMAVAAALSYFSYERHPHIPDEVAYLYQARFFADGVLSMPAPPVKEGFDFYLMQFEADRWYPSPPPGWPAMLALGTRLGIPWLVNPVLAGLNVLLTYVILKEIYDRRVALAAIFLLCVSPWHIFMAMNFMTHTFTLTCALIASLGVIWARRKNKAVWAWLGGLALGMMSLIRPLEAVTMAGLLGLWAVGVGGKRLKASALVGLVVGAILVGAAVLVYNRALTGDPTVFPIMAYTDQRFGPNSNALGFGPDRGMGWPIDPYLGHSPRDAIINTDLNTFSINIELFGWGTGSLILIALLVFSGEFRKTDYLMLAVIAAVAGVHFFYYFSGGPDFGARYWFLMLVPCVALSVRGIQVLGGKLATDGQVGSPLPHTWAVAGVVALSLIALVTFFPWRAIDKYHHYLGMRPDIRYLADVHQFGDSLVLIQGDEHPDYASAATYNPLDVRAEGPIYVRDVNPEVRAELLAAYPDRSAWIVEGPSLTKAGFRVTAGPLTAHELQKGGDALP